MPLGDCRIVDLPRVTDPRGNLTFIEGSRHVPFAIQRVYYLYDVPGGAERGGHGHKELHQLIIAMSAVMFTAFATVRRFGDPVHPRATGAVMAVSAAAAAGMVINLRCSCATPLHVAVGHVLPLAVASLAGVGFGWLLLRLKRSPAHQNV